MAGRRGEERRRTIQEITELEDLYIQASQERERTRQRYVELLIDLIQHARVDNKAMVVLIRFIRSENATREVLNALVQEGIASMEQW